MQKADVKRPKQAITNIIKILISVVLVIVLYNIIDFNFVLREITSMSPWFFVSVLLVSALSIVVEVSKWRILMPAVPFGQYLKAFMYGEFFTLALPGQVFGEAAKIVRFGKDSGRYDQSISTVIIDKITAVLGLIVFGLFGLLFTKAELPKAFVAILLTCMIGALFVLFLLRIGRVRRLLLAFVRLPVRISPRFQKFCDGAAGVVDTWHEYLFKPKLLLKTFGCGLLLYVVILFQYVLICRQYNIPVSVVDLCWIMPTINVVQALPISFAGIGVRDISLVTMLAYVGVSADNSMVLAMVLLLVIITRAIAGAVFILSDVAHASMSHSDMAAVGAAHK